MYESPIAEVMSDISTQLIQEKENQIMMQMRQTVGYDIDKNELIKALQYDRNQYKKGYADCKEKIVALLREEIDRNTLKDIPSEDGCRLCELKSEYAIHVESVLNQVELLI